MKYIVTFSGELSEHNEAVEGIAQIQILVNVSEKEHAVGRAYYLLMNMGMRTQELHLEGVEKM